MASNFQNSFDFFGCTPCLLMGNFLTDDLTEVCCQNSQPRKFSQLSIFDQFTELLAHLFQHQNPDSLLLGQLLSLRTPKRYLSIELHLNLINILSAAPFFSSLSQLLAKCFPVSFLVYMRGITHLLYQLVYKVWLTPGLCLQCLRLSLQGTFLLARMLLLLSQLGELIESCVLCVVFGGEWWRWEIFNPFF